MITMTQVLLPDPAPRYAHALAAFGQRLRNLWEAGPAPYWTDYLHQTRD